MKQTKFYAMLFSLACMAGIASCSDDNEMKPALSDPTVTETMGSYNSLSFSWEDVANAVQYGYRLADSEGIAIDAGVTQKKSVTFRGLTPATTYTLSVWAFASMDGDYSTPPAVTLTATTDALVKLGIPTGLTLSSENGYDYTATWTPVEHASTYSWSVADASGTQVTGATTESTSVALKNLENGEYRFTVYAVGYDGYESGASASAEFKVDKPEHPDVLFTVKGSYYSLQLNASWDAYMEAYSDGTYSILAYYGVEGYNLDFKIDRDNADDMFTILNGEYYDDTVAGYVTWRVPTGLANPADIYAYPWSNYSQMTGNETEGKVEIGNYAGENYAEWGYDVFTWPTENSGELTIDDLVGTYNNHFVGEEYLTDPDYQLTTWDSTWEATITKNSNNTIMADGLFFSDDPVEGIVDFKEMTITFQPQDGYSTWYRFADNQDPNSPAIGYINGDGSISVPDFGVWYNYSDDPENPDWARFLSGTSELTKASAAERPTKNPGRISTPAKKPEARISVTPPKRGRIGR